ncbi:hypothetical protein BDV97DRAFT_147238 [Delphinella strobiligena]|nr:hypothetical protein BDV97DRAFT_147238 [Delphinella strobiligena]
MPPAPPVRRLQRRSEGLVRKAYALFNVTEEMVDVAVIVEARPGIRLSAKKKALVFRSSESYFPRVDDLLKSKQTKSQVPFDFQTLREAQVNGVHNDNQETSDGESSDASSVPPRQRSRRTKLLRRRKLGRGQRSHKEESQHMARSEPGEHDEPDAETGSAHPNIPIGPYCGPVSSNIHAAETDMLLGSPHGDFGDVEAWGLGFKIDTPISHQQASLRHGEDLDSELDPHNAVFAEPVSDLGTTTVTAPEPHQEQLPYRFTTPPPYLSPQKPASQPIRNTSDWTPDAWRLSENEHVSKGASSRALQSSSPSPAQRFRHRQQVGLSAPTSHGPSFIQKVTSRPARLESLSVSGPLRRGVQVNRHRIGRHLF